MFACALAFAGAFLGGALQIFDLDLLKHVLAQTEWGRDWDDIQQATGPYQKAMVVSALAWVVTAGITVYGWWVDREGGAYWFYRSGRARRFLVEHGNADPHPYQVARALMKIEQDEGGWRPETVLRFLAESHADHQAPVDRAWLDEIKAWSVQARRDADDHLRRNGASTLMQLSGVAYDPEDIATLTELIDDRLMDLRFRDARPFPTPSETG